MLGASETQPQLGQSPSTLRVTTGQERQVEATEGERPAYPPPDRAQGPATLTAPDLLTQLAVADEAVQLLGRPLKPAGEHCRRRAASLGRVPEFPEMGPER